MKIIFTFLLIFALPLQASLQTACLKKLKPTTSSCHQNAQHMGPSVQTLSSDETSQCPICKKNLCLSFSPLKPTYSEKHGFKKGQKHIKLVILHQFARSLPSPYVLKIQTPPASITYSTASADWQALFSIFII